MARILGTTSQPTPHTHSVALYLTLFWLSWPLAACSAVLWLRKYPRRSIKLWQSGRGWQSTTFLLAAVMVGVYGGVNLALRYHRGGWLIPALFVPLSLIATAAPIRIRRWQLRHSLTQPAGLESSTTTPPTA